MTARVKILAVDDEPLALQRIRLICRKLPEVELVGEAPGCQSALMAIAALKPQILLLDIKMRDGSGFDVLDQIPQEQSPAVIFVTAFDHYAVRAFEACAVDYVLKPVQFERLQTAVERARDKLASQASAVEMQQLKTVIAALRAGSRDDARKRYEDELWIRRNVTGFTRVPVETIDWVSSEDDYVRVHTPAGSHLMRGSISSLAERIDPSLFVRIHRKTLVNKMAIKELRRPRIGKLEVVLRSGQRLETGRVYAKELRRTIKAQAA